MSYFIQGNKIVNEETGNAREIHIVWKALEPGTENKEMYEEISFLPTEKVQESDDKSEENVLRSNGYIYRPKIVGSWLILFQQKEGTSGEAVKIYEIINDDVVNGVNRYDEHLLEALKKIRMLLAKEDGDDETKNLLEDFEKKCRVWAKEQD